MQQNRTEEEILKEHGELSKYGWQKLYQFFVPLLEAHDALMRTLYLNREMYTIKNPPKAPDVEDKKA